MARTKTEVQAPPAGQGERRAVWRDLGVYGVVVVLYVLLALKEPSFRGFANFRNVLTQIGILSLVAVGMTFVIITGGIDLSVGSVAALAACASSILMVHHGWSGAAGMLLTLALGAGIGLVNGVSIAKVGLPPFIATLAMMVMARGLAFIVSGGGAIYPPVSDRPADKLTSAQFKSYLWAGSGNLFERFPLIEYLPLIVVLIVVCYGAGHIFLQRTRTGRYLYSVGSNEEATRLSGVPTDRVKIFCYTLCGLLAGLAGMLFAGRVGASEPTIGDGLELDVIAAVVIGGTSLSGGQGSLPGTFAGALLIGLVRNGLNLMQVDSNWQKVAIGAIIYLAVMIDMFQRKRRRI